jgi:putative addiction module killer protein
VIEIRKTDIFESWFVGLRDIKAARRIQVRIDRLQFGNPGDVKPVGEGVSEMRIDYGPGYRVYYKEHRGQFILLLAGGNKRSQQQDIKAAIELAEWI